MNPQSLVNIVPGSTVEFIISAAGKSLTYQWLMDGVQLTESDKYFGTTNTTLSIVGISYPDNEGLYSVIVSNTAGSVTSDPALLDISMWNILSALCMPQNYFYMMYT